MTSPAYIFLSCDAADNNSAADLKRQLATALQPRIVVFFERHSIPPEEFRAKAAAFLERADLFIAVLSMQYEDTADVRWETDQAIHTQENRPALQIATLFARSATIPLKLQPFPQLLPPGETVENEGIARDRQLLRASDAALLVMAAAPPSNAIEIGHIELPLGIEDLVERLRAQTDRINHAPLLAILKRLIRDVEVKRKVLDIEESFKQLREKTRLSQISISELGEQSDPIQKNLLDLIEQLREIDLVAEWRQIFIRDYYRFVSDSREDSTVPPFFVPVDEIIIPETHNLSDSEAGPTPPAGLLSFEQKNDFRRSLLLAKDAMAVKNPAQAFAHCDHVRTRIDPQSAQVYEYLLLSFLQKETALRAMQNAVSGNDRLLQHVLLYASRLREYQRDGKCPSSTAQHNLAIASEGISDAALRLYHALPNDPLRHTGKHEGEVPDNRRALRVILENTLKVCRLVHPSEELLEAAVIECFGGGKCHWMERVDVVGDRFQFVPNGHFDLLGEINELLTMLREMEADDPNKIVKGRGLLREDLYFSLLAKRQAFATQLKEDEKRRRPFTDVRESVIRFTYACLLGATIFGDEDERGRGNSFLRLALEYLLPGLLVVPGKATDLGDLRWFTLNAQGEVIAHPDCAKYQFDALGIVEKIIRDHAGQAGWLQVAPNIKQSVYNQFLADTQAVYETVKNSLTHTDFRRMDMLTARGLLIRCLRDWRTAYRAYPDVAGQEFLDNSIEEIAGLGLMVWLRFDVDGQLATVPDSLALGYDAQADLREMLSLSIRYTEADLRRSISAHIFENEILPTYETLRKSDETQRVVCARLMREALYAYKLHQDLRFLDFVWRELTEEIKFRWVDVTSEGKEISFRTLGGFDALAVLYELNEILPKRFRLYQLRERVAMHRFRDEEAKYFHEISEFRHENRVSERRLVVDVIRKLKGLYHYFPKEEFLQLPMDELQGRGRVRWHANLFGLRLLPLTENHYENRYFNFEYKYERFELKRLLDNQFAETQRVLRETGEL